MHFAWVGVSSPVDPRKCSDVVRSTRIAKRPILVGQVILSAGLQRRWSCCHHAVSRTSNASVPWPMLVFAPAPPSLPQRRRPHTASLKMPSRDKARHQAWQWLPHKALCCIQMLKQQEKSARARIGAGEAKPGMQFAWWSAGCIGHDQKVKARTAFL